MGAGKTSIGRRLAARLGLPFRDADAEIEAGGRLHDPGIFRQFRRSALPRRRAAGDPAAAGGRPAGAGFRRRRLHGSGNSGSSREAVSVWLRAPCRRCCAGSPGRDHRPLLVAGDPAEILRRLMDQRHPGLCRGGRDRGLRRREPGCDHRPGAGGLARPGRRRGGCRVALRSASYDVVIGDGPAGAGRRAAGAAAAAEARGDRDRRDGGGAASAALRAGLAEAGIASADRRAARRGFEEPGDLQARGRSSCWRPGWSGGPP